MNSTVERKVTVITGGTGALGSAVTRAFVEKGAHVVVTYVVDAERTALETSLASERLSFEKVNLFSETEVADLCARVAARFKKIDNLILLAGGFAGGKPVTETPFDEWERMLSLNATAAFLCSKYGMPLLKEQGGAIVTVGSTMAASGTGNFAAYGASKAALINLTEALAVEGKPHRVRANVVVPTIIDTPANRSAMPNADITQWVPPANLAEVILFLCSEHGARISGQTIKVG